MSEQGYSISITGNNNDSNLILTSASASITEQSSTQTSSITEQDSYLTFQPSRDILLNLSGLERNKTLNKPNEEDGLVWQKLPEGGYAPPVDGAGVKYSGKIVNTPSGDTVLVQAFDSGPSNISCINVKTGKLLWRRWAVPGIDTEADKFMFDLSLGIIVNPNSDSSGELRAVSATNETVTFGDKSAWEVRNTPFIDLSRNEVWINSSSSTFVGCYDLTTGARKYQVDTALDQSGNLPSKFETFDDEKWLCPPYYNEVKGYSSANLKIRPDIHVDYENGVPMVYCGYSGVDEYDWRSMFNSEDYEELGHMTIQSEFRKFDVSNNKLVWSFKTLPKEIFDVSGETLPDECFAIGEDTLNSYSELYHGFPFQDNSLNTIHPSQNIVSVYFEDPTYQTYEISLNELKNYMVDNSGINKPLPHFMSSANAGEGINFIAQAPGALLGNAPTQQIKTRLYEDASGNVKVAVPNQDPTDFARPFIITDLSISVIEEISFNDLSGLPLYQDIFRSISNENLYKFVYLGKKGDEDLSGTYHYIKDNYYDMMVKYGIVDLYGMGWSADFQNVITIVYNHDFTIGAYRTTFDDMILVGGMNYVAVAQSDYPNILIKTPARVAIEKNYIPHRLDFSGSFVDGTSLDHDASYNFVPADPTGPDASFVFGHQIIGPHKHSKLAHNENTGQRRVASFKKIQLHKGYQFVNTEGVNDEYKLLNKYIAYNENMYGGGVWQQGLVVDADTITFPVGNCTKQTADDHFTFENRKKTGDSVIAAHNDLVDGKITQSEYKSRILKEQVTSDHTFSPRSKRSCHDSITTLRKSDGALIQILKTVNFDAWSTSSVGGIFSFFSGGMVPPQEQLPYGRVKLLEYGPDGDTNSALRFVNKDGLDYIGTIGKSGIAVMAPYHSVPKYVSSKSNDIHMDHGINMPSTDVSGIVRKVMGFGGTLGGPNYQIDTDGRSMFYCTANFPILQLEQPIGGFKSISQVQDRTFVWEFTKYVDNMSKLIPERNNTSSNIVLNGKKFTLGNKLSARMGTQYVGCVNDTGIVWESLCNRSIDTVTQAIMPPTAVIYNKGLVWVGAGDHILCFDTDNGNIVTKLEAPNQYGVGMCSPSIGNGHVTFIGPGIGAPFIVSPSTNKMITVYDIDNI